MVDLIDAMDNPLKIGIAIYSGGFGREYLIV